MDSKTLTRILSTPCLGRINSLQNIECMSQTSSCILSMEPEEFDGIDNIVDLTNRSSDKVIAFMRKRFLSKEFYTWAGQTLLSLHPYETKRKNKGVAPGVDSVITGAWFRLKHSIGKQHQHVVISGESGSGKTHSACLAMQRIVDIVGETNLALYGIWSTVPLLSAFGNAKTGYNCNSSRFGKLVQIHCADDMSIDGCTLRIFMLEKSRVTGPAPGEGNFHIFRQILDVLEEDALQLLYLSKTIDYKIAPPSEMKPRYRETLIALEALEIYALEDILSVLAIILNLGNVKFESVGDIYTVSTDSLEFVENVGRLLGAKPKDLINLICTRVFSPKSRRETIYQSACKNRAECEERRDCIMKLLYDRLFTWLVFCVNAKFEHTYVCAQKSLSILDIYGFEVFDHNGFEQLCINYANERLQQYFIDNYLLERRIHLIEEGFDVEHIETVDYTQRLSLIHGPISIFGILNEECAMKRFNSDVFVNTRLTETLRSKPHFIGSLNQLHTAFSIKHYAGVVKYDTRLMLGKNRDKVPDDIISFLKGCESFEFLCHLMSFAPLTNGKTLITNFKKSLDNLVDILNDGDVHYVKCLKPNPYHMAEFFDEHFFGQQLAANGVCEIFKLNFQQFSLRLRFEDFIEKFSENLYNSLKDFLKKEMHLGKRFVYMTDGAYTKFVTLRRIRSSMLIRRIQLAWQRYHERRRNAAAIVCRFMRRLCALKNVRRYEKFIDLSKKSSEVCILEQQNIGNSKTEDFLSKHSFDLNFEGDQLSLTLEKICSDVEVKPFKRVLFFGDRIVSFNRLAEIPVRFHLARTCFKYSNVLPRSELPYGLPDIF